MDLLVTPSTNESCLFSDFINVLGNYCSNCMGLTAYSDIFALHTDSPFSYSKGCEFNGTLGAVYDEDNLELMEKVTLLSAAPLPRLRPLSSGLENMI